MAAPLDKNSKDPPLSPFSRWARRGSKIAVSHDGGVYNENQFLWRILRGT